MNRTRVGAATVGALVLAFLLRLVPVMLVGRWLSGDPEATPLPLFGTFGETMAVYTGLASLLGSAGTLGPGVVLGYWVARRSTDEDELRRGLRPVGLVVASVVGLIVVGAVAWGVFSGSAGFVSILRYVDAVITVFLTIVAGAGLERFDLLGDAANETADPAPGVDAPR